MNVKTCFLEQIRKNVSKCRLLIFFFFDCATGLCNYYFCKHLMKYCRGESFYHTSFSWPRWLSWMRRRTGDQEVAGLTAAEVSNILSWRLIVKYFLRSFSPFH